MDQIINSVNAIKFMVSISYSYGLILTITNNNLTFSPITNIVKGVIVHVEL